MTQHPPPPPADPRPVPGLPRPGEQILLLNPPVYDTRLHWARWLQPTGLLRLASYGRRVGADVRLLDLLYARPGPLRRTRIDFLTLDTIVLPRWRFGLPVPQVRQQLRAWNAAGWQPDTVYIEGFTTFWWEGTAETVRLVRQFYPQARIIVLGAYAALTPDHVQAESGAEPLPALPTLVVDGPLDLSLYDPPPLFTYVTLGAGQRTPTEIVDEIATRRAAHGSYRGIQHIAFAEHDIAGRFPAAYRAVLEELAARDLDVNLYALGSITPASLAADPELARLMRRAGYVQIHFADDRAVAPEPAAGMQLVEEYHAAAVACAAAGFPMRTEVLSAGICLGRRGDDLAERVALITRAAHALGSVILWPYQPPPEDCPDLPLAAQNGKFFPFRTANGYSYREYLDVMGLTVVLNAKYRTRTFDFLGTSLTARLVQESLARRGWDPDPDLKGSLRLPVLERRR